MRTASTVFTSRVKKPHGVFEKVKTFMTKAWVLQKSVKNEAPKAAGLGEISSLTDTLTTAQQSSCSQFQRAVLMVGLVHSTGDQETERLETWGGLQRPTLVISVHSTDSKVVP